MRIFVHNWCEYSSKKMYIALRAFVHCIWAQWSTRASNACSVIHAFICAASHFSQNTMILIDSVIFPFLVSPHFSWLILSSTFSSKCQTANSEHQYSKHEWKGQEISEVMPLRNTLAKASLKRCMPDAIPSCSHGEYVVKDDLCENFTPNRFLKIRLHYHVYGYLSCP